jgi:hypothetical protein
MRRSAKRISAEIIQSHLGFRCGDRRAHALEHYGEYLGALWLQKDDNAKSDLRQIGTLGEIDGAIPNFCRIRLRFRAGMNFSPGARREQGDVGGKAACVSFRLSY